MIANVERNFRYRGWLWATFVIMAIAVLALTAGPARAQEPTADEVNEVARYLNCPTCATRALDDCNTQTCIQWKEQIKDLMMQGYTRQEILDWYVERYGQHVLQEPPLGGITLFVWLLPALGVLAGAVWLGIMLRNWSARRAESAPVAAARSATQNEGPQNEDYLRRVEQDLKNL